MITIKPNELKALAMFAANTKDLRECARARIQGVHVEQRKGRTILVATNGYSLGALCLDAASDSEESYMIPNAALKAVNLKGGPVDIHPHGDYLTVIQGATNTTYEIEISQYPDFRRVIPDKVSGEAGHFDASIVGEIGKAYALMTGCKSTPGIICHNGTSGALLDFGRDDFVGVLMPTRNGPTRFTSPGWLS